VMESGGFGGCKRRVVGGKGLGDAVAVNGADSSGGRDRDGGERERGGGGWRG